jgi:hypothetical protein
LNKEEVYEAEVILEDLLESDMQIHHKVAIERLLELIVPMAEKERLKDYKDSRGIKWSWSDFHPHKKLQDSIRTLSSAVTFHQEAKLEEEIYEKETQDILHALELTELDDEQILVIGKELQLLRQKRRNAKDFMELVAPLFAYSTKNRNVVKELGQVLSEMQQTMNSWETRRYTVREKTELQYAFDTAKESGKKTALQEAFEKAEAVS